ncbi:MAG: hydroxymethylbilane synthase [Desulfovibrio sp.]|jgi:hydroxymethylbilane synthase|nr:hydroxymethylbilane synthase [Desulfovibrio sp.]
MARPDDSLVIATRGSRLALWQAEHVKARLARRRPGLDIRLKVVKTTGDRILDVPLAKVGGKGLFVKEIEEALLAGEADIAVHSIKDVPMVLPEGLTLGAIPAREDPRDMFLGVRHPDVEALPPNATVGTSSLRRQALLLERRPDLRIVGLRGNVDTRLRKLVEGECDAIVLAAAGLKRLGLQAPVMLPLSPDRFLPAIGQGALGIECRAGNRRALELLAGLEDKGTRCCVEAERGLLAGLEGGCQVPIAGHASMEDGRITLRGLVATTDGDRVLRREIQGSPEDPRRLGLELAELLLRAGGRNILDELLHAVR